MSRNIKVPIICNEDWDKMSPKENGRFCDTCKLTVVDFTKMSDNEIKNYLLSKSYVCGRFDCTQVETSHEKTLELLKRKTKKINFKPLRWAAFLLLLIPALIYNSCRGVYRPPTGRLMGAVAMPYFNDSIKYK